MVRRSGGGERADHRVYGAVVFECSALHANVRPALVEGASLREQAFEILPRAANHSALVEVSEALFEFDLNASLNRRGNGTWLMRPVVRQVGSAR